MTESFSHNSRCELQTIIFVSPPNRVFCTGGNALRDRYGLDGGRIPNTRVIIHWDPIGLDGVTNNEGTKDDKVSATDETGDFSVELPPGVYDIFLSAGGFSPHCEKISMKGNIPRNYVARLTVSRMLSIKVD